MKKFTIIEISVWVLLCFGPALVTSQAAEKEVIVTNTPLPVKEANCQRKIVAFSGQPDDGDEMARVFIPDKYYPNRGEILIIETVSVLATFSSEHPSPVHCGIATLGGLGHFLAAWAMTPGYEDDGQRSHMTTQQLRIYIPYFDPDTAEVDDGPPYVVGISLRSSTPVGYMRASIYGYIVSDQCHCP